MRAIERLCEQCRYPTAGFLRMTTRRDGVRVRACEDCALDIERDKNREPADHDGEAFRGGERAAFERGQQADAMRRK